MKKCIKCGESKPLDKFNKKKAAKDGKYSYCVTCSRSAERARYYISKSEVGKHERMLAKQRAKDKRRYRMHPEKAKAKQTARCFVKCVDFPLHHWSYKSDHWKDVIRLSYKDHLLAHTEMKYSDTHMQYRTLKGLLLRTRDIHVEYLESLGIYEQGFAEVRS